MKGYLTNVLVGSAPGLGAALAGAPWWAVATLAGGAIGLPYLIVYVLAGNPRITRIKTFPISCELHPPEPPDTS